MGANAAAVESRPWSAPTPIARMARSYPHRAHGALLQPSRPWGVPTGAAPAR